MPPDATPPPREPPVAPGDYRPRVDLPIGEAWTGDIDEEQIDHLLSLTPAERLRRHARALKGLRRIRRAVEASHGPR